jgi:uncharacterized protein
MTAIPAAFSAGLPAAASLAPYAALLALIYVYLTFRVIKARYRAKAALGTAGDAGLERAVRVHGNFAEYAPFGLLLILLVGLTGWSVWAVHGLGALLLAARLLHAYGVSQSDENLNYRKFGMIGTFTVFVVCAFLLLIKGIF